MLISNVIFLLKKVEATVIRVQVPDTRTGLYRLDYEGWLIIERVGAEFKYYIANLPKSRSWKSLLRLAHLRWKIEQGYQQLKEELGLDHFEGRSWRGLHHHITLCNMAYGFLILLQQEEKKGLRRTSPFHKSEGGLTKSLM